MGRGWAVVGLLLGHGQAMGGLWVGRGWLWVGRGWAVGRQWAMVNNIQGSAESWSPGCMNAAGKARQNW